MPASRSRTDRWRDCLDQVFERGGGLEISLARPQTTPGAPTSETAAAGADLVWRVRILKIDHDQIVLEAPNTLGRPVSLVSGTPLIGAMSIGQNRWMFRTSVIEQFEVSQGRAAQPMGVVRVQMPTGVERCSRRDFYRVSTAELNLPHVECWPLLDPTTVTSAEVANRALILDLERSPSPSIAGFESEVDAFCLPEVGPRFMARLLNLGGGGAGLSIDRSESGPLERARLLWLRIDLRPHIPAPIGMTARIAHTHLDSMQHTYAGLAFDFSFNPSHREFIVSQISRYVASFQNARAKAA